MPRRVVPMRVAAFDDSRKLSSSRCSGRISVAFSAMRRFCGRDLDALPGKPLDLLDQRMRIEHDAVADDRNLAGPQHARRQQRELVGRAVDDQRVAGIVAALEAHHDVGLGGQPVDDLALALVAPLRADHHHVRHRNPSRPHTRPRATTGARSAMLLANNVSV